MGILDNLTKKTPLTQAKENIDFMDNQIQHKYLALGRSMYQNYKKGINDLSLYQEDLKRLERDEINRASYYANWLQLQGLMECANCQSKIPFGSVFCSSCGKKASEKSDNGGNKLVSANSCKNCGAEMEADAMFCTSCGTKKE